MATVGASITQTGTSWCASLCVTSDPRQNSAWPLPMNRWKNSPPVSSEPMASTISGTPMVQGGSWACASTSFGSRGLPSKARNISRQE